MTARTDYHAPMKRTLILAALAALLLPAGLFAEEKTAASSLWDGLAHGNHDYAAGKPLAEQRTLLRDHQNPGVTILGCSDSRVPPELIFNQTLGSLFVIRTAGNIADEFGIASIEYAIANGYTKLIVVLGHEECGAVKAAIRADDPGTPALRDLVKRIRMSFGGMKWDPNDPAFVQRAVEMNARAAAASLMAESAVIRDAVLSGKVQLVTAWYDLDTGEVFPLPPGR